MIFKLFGKAKGLISGIFLSRYIGSAVQSFLQVAGAWLVLQGAGSPDDIAAVKEALGSWASSPEFADWVGTALIGGGVIASFAQDKKESKEK